MLRLSYLSFAPNTGADLFIVQPPGFQNFELINEPHFQLTPGFDNRLKVYLFLIGFHHGNNCLFQQYPLLRPAGRCLNSGATEKFLQPG